MEEEMVHDTPAGRVTTTESLNILANMPDIEQIMEWEAEGEMEATDGCWVESDGTCEHGKKSWMLVMGLI